MSCECSPPSCPTSICCDGVPTLVNNACGNSATGPGNLPGCTPPEFNPLGSNDGQAYAPGQTPWTSVASKPPSLLCAPPQWAQAQYAEYFGLNAIPSTAEQVPYAAPTDWSYAAVVPVTS